MALYVIACAEENSSAVRLRCKIRPSLDELTDQDRSTNHKANPALHSLPVEAEQLAPRLRGFGYLVVEAIVDLRTRKVELVFSAVRQITGRINVPWSFERSLSLSQRRVALERGEYHSRLMRMFLKATLPVCAWIPI
jgi:hypothetical protein